MAGAWVRVAIIIGFLIATPLGPTAALAEPSEATLEGRAVLPADTFAEGPASGSGLGEDEPKGGRTPPLEGQPVGGVSSVLDAGGDEYLAMTDNGFGKKENSADFDVESMGQDARGDLWFGDEFGPFLLHTDTAGRVLQAPMPLPGVKSPENPTLGAEEEPNLPTSKGFEGMAVSGDGGTLYPMLEGALEDDPDQGQRFIYEFGVGSKRYTGERWRYRTEEPEHSIGDLTALDDYRFLAIERDNEQGEEASFKKVYLVGLRRTEAEGFLIKQEVLDLLSIRDPNLISEPPREGDIGLGDPFSFPFQTIESILPLEGGWLLLLNDNNYPLSAGRNPGQPDDTEAIIVRPEALKRDPAAQTPAARMPDTGGPSLSVAVGMVLLTSILVIGILCGNRRARGSERGSAAQHPR